MNKSKKDLIDENTELNNEVRILHNIISDMSHKHNCKDSKIEVDIVMLDLDYKIKLNNLNEKWEKKYRSIKEELQQYLNKNDW